MSKDLFDERRDYEALSLSRADLSDDPHDLFSQWLESARDAKIVDATAMTLATVDASLQPHARVVLLKDFGSDGFTFFTNRHSAKGQELDTNPLASLLFYWQKFERQIRINGTVSLVSAELSARYFHSRPEQSRFSAAASKQSKPVTDRHHLESRVNALHAAHPDGQVACPDSWAGYCVKAQQFEFWQGRTSRLHDRFRYTLDDNNVWQATRLDP